MFLISLKAGGFGLNLTEADYCFLLDPWWNPATEAQAVDRTHRIGQTRHVMVYRLIASGTIEEKVMALKARKAELFSSVIDSDGAFSFGAVRRRHPRALRLIGRRPPPAFCLHRTINFLPPPQRVKVTVNLGKEVRCGAPSRSAPESSTFS